MQRISFAFVATVSAMLAFAGCAVSPEQDDGEGTTEELTQSVLSGQFTLNGAAHGIPFAVFTLKANHSFEAVLQGASHASVSGSWKTKRVGPEGGAAALELKTTGAETSTYFYSFRSDQLSLRQSPAGTPSVFDKDLSHLGHLRTNGVCRDRYDNTLGLCPDNLACIFDGPSSTTQRCLPPI